MKESKKVIVAAAVGTVFALTVISACGKASDAAKADGATTAKTSESVSVTNDNGSVTRSFTECNVTTNGSMVTERRRETRTTTDTAGNVLETSTSEYAQSYPVGDVGLVSLAKEAKADENAAAKADNSSFLGLEFGSVFEGTNFVKDVDEPTLLRAGYTPKKALAGFDDYYVYVTPTTHKVVKVFACAKESVDPGARGRRHYLLEALEKRYGTWARLCSWSRPRYAFDIGDGRWVVATLAGASRDYETVVGAWDDAMLTVAADETEAIRAEARKNAAERRMKRVDDAADAF